jgi:hypothetical protein
MWKYLHILNSCASPGARVRQTISDHSQIAGQLPCGNTLFHIILREENMMSKKSLLLGLSLLATVGFGDPATSAGDGTMTPADQMQWQEMEPGSPLKIVMLWGDRSKGEYAMLLKLPAGFVAPIHAHTGDY